MNVLVTNDDGILAEGLWVLAKELKNIGHVVVVAPDREQSAIGTAVTLTQPLRVQKVRAMVPGIDAFAVQGTPGDSVIVGLETIVKGKVDIVVSGINHGLNVGNDVLISGTVGAALQGFLRGFPAIAVSLAGTEIEYLETAAGVGAAVAKMVRARGADSAGHSRGNLNSAPPGPPILLNVNLPDLRHSDLKGIRVTRLASESHIDTVEEGNDGRRKYYWLVRRRIAERVHSEMTDIWAVDKGYVSITPLHIYQESGSPIAVDGFCTDALCSDLWRELQHE